MNNVKTHPPLFLPIFVTLLFSLLFGSITYASDREKEKRWAEQIEDALLDGEAVYLNDGTADFLAIDTRAEEPKDVGIIVIHGIGIHPDWETVIQPLRIGLSEKGWNTLSLQMPILPNEATGDDYKPLMKEVPARIDAGIRALFNNGAKKVIIVAHSLGAQMTTYYLAHKKVYKEAQTDTPIIAFIGIGMGPDNIPNLEKITIPVVDIYGENDLPGVTKSAAKRLKAAAHNKHYQQQKIPKANHFFEGQDEDLVNAIAKALSQFQ